MLRSGENESEILLGNKQLLGIFFVVAALLGVAFTGGYMVGRGGLKKTAASVAATVPPDATAGSASAASAASGGETHALTPADSSSVADNEPVRSTAQPEIAGKAAEPLGSRKHKDAVTPDLESAAPSSSKPTAKGDSFIPQPGEEFLQVTSVTRDHANAVAAVLRHKGFRAHAVPKPGNPNLYRVIIGPIRDAGDLASTRDSLRKTGFREVIVQHYQ